MRIEEGRHPVVRRGSSFHVEVDGMPIPAYEGETIASMLLSGGHRAFRRTRNRNAPRGLFCGIGVCYDCLVVVDGLPNRRACMTLAAPGMRVQTQRGVGSSGQQGDERG